MTNSCNNCKWSDPFSTLCSHPLIIRDGDHAHNCLPCDKARTVGLCRGGLLFEVIPAIIWDKAKEPYYQREG